MTPSDYELNVLQYSENPGPGPWKIYIYRPDGYHTGGRWFRKGPAKYPDEEISLTSAKVRCANAMRNGAEVRICDGGDMLVFHAKGAKVIYPPEPRDFWKEIA